MKSVVAAKRKYTILETHTRNLVRETGMDFSDAFAQVKADGKNILRVTMAFQQGKCEERSSPNSFLRI